MGNLGVVLALVPALVLVGCASTPELRVDSSDVSARMTAKAPFLSSAAYAPDGSSIATADAAGGLRLWDLRKGELAKTLKGSTAIVWALAFSPNGKTLASFNSEGVRLWNVHTGAQLWLAPGGNVTGWKRLLFSPDGKSLLTYSAGFIGSGEFKVHDAANGTVLKTFSGSSTRQALLAVSRPEYACAGKVFGNHPCIYQAVTPDGRLALRGEIEETGLISISTKYTVVNLHGGGLVRQLDVADEAKGSVWTSMPSGGLSPDGKLVAVVSLASTRILEVASGREIATVIAFEDGEWVITTPSGYYNASDKGDQRLSIAVAGKQYGISQLRESFYRPDLVKAALAGRSLSDQRRLADVKAAPMVEIVGAPAHVTVDEVAIRVRVADQGGGIGDVRLYLNGSAVVLDNTRNLQVGAKEGPAVTMSYNLRLLPEKNVIQAVAFNADNSLRSNEAVVQVEARFAERQPTLHALVVGIQDYENPRLALRYAVADARLVAATLRERATGLFQSVQVTELTTRSETTRDSITQALTAAKAKVRPEDLFVFFVASHGTVDEDEYFLVTSNVGSVSTNALRANALSQGRLKELLANIPATKKLIVIDTCNAGKLGEAVDVALMTRGMNEETAMKILSRAVGSTILSASSTVQQAVEGYQGHGLFTYVVVEGLKGAADFDKDGFIKTLELASYIDDRVPQLAEQVFKHKQYPLVSPSGQGFPVTRVK